MILAGDLKPGSKLLYNNEPYVVIDVVFVKPGKGGAFARTKMKNLISHLQREVTYRTEEKIAQPDLKYVSVQYLYSTDDAFCFMDQESFEEIFIGKKQAESVKHFMREQEIMTLLFWNDAVIEIIPPIHLILKVVDTTPGVRGDSSQSPSKSATLETGLVVQVPLFVAIDDLVKVDTRTGEYVERCKK